MSVASKLKTHAELCLEAASLPEPLVGEVIDGVLYTMARPSPAHSSVETALTSQLRFGGGGGGPAVGWYIAAEVEVRFPNDETCVPDVSGWRSSKISGHRNDNPIRVTPDWACEILSDSTRKKDLGPKRDMYARQGVTHLWIVEPEAHVLEVYSLGAARRWELVGTWVEDSVVSAAPFEALKLQLSSWWLKEADPG